MKEPWQIASIYSHESVGSAAEALERGGLQIVFVLNNKRQLIGTITDGDIRRGLLKGLDLTSKVFQILNEAPLVAPPGMASEDILDLMKTHKVRQLPILNDNGELLGVHLWDELFETQKKENIIVIMCGGEGQRMRPLTNDCPKPMIKVGGKPILERIILQAKSEGFDKFIISVNYLKEVIKNHFSSGDQFGVNITYLEEDEPLGTAGCLKKISKKLGQSFVVTNGDLISEVKFADLLEYHKKFGAVATMAVRNYEWQNPFGVVTLKGADIIGFEEKPTYSSQVNTGVYALHPEALKHLPSQKHFDMPTLFDRLRVANQKTVAYPMHETWLDVGRPEDIAVANKIIIKE